MEQQQPKRFSFFTGSVRRFLNADLKTVDDFVVMVRITPQITVLNYIGTVTYLAFFLTESLAFLGIVLPYALSEATWKLLAFFWKHGWQSPAAMLTYQTMTLRFQPYLIMFSVNVACVAAGLWIVAQSKRAWREWRGLRMMHTMTQEQRKDFSLQHFLRISLPSWWLLPSITYDPTPEQLQRLLRESEQAIAGRTQAIASALAREEDAEEEQEEHPSIRMLLVLTDHLALSLLGPSGMQITVHLTDAVASLVGFLATRAQEAWTAREMFFQQYLYSEWQDGLFTRHRERTNAQINARVQKEGFLLQPATERDQEEASVSEPIDPTTEDEQDAEHSGGDEQTTPATSSDEEIDLFEHKTEGQDSFWRLTPRCNVEMFPFLTMFHPKVMRAKAPPEDPTLLSLEELRQGCHRLMEEYGLGFLAKHMKKGNSVWFWARPFYRQYREQCWNILSYAITRESTYLDTLNDVKESHEVIEWIAQLFGWRAIVATGLDLKGEGSFSEEDIMQCLSYYGQMRKRSDARDIYQRYSTLRSEIDPAYEPGEELQKLVDEVLYPQRKAARSRKL
jgi:hypothetical protein